MPINKQKRKERLERFAKEKEIGLLGMVSEIEERLDEELPALKDIISRVKGDPGKDADGEKIKDEVLTEVLSEIPTPEAIARLVKVPTPEEIAKLVKVIPAKDGYTPQKGVDYFDGKPGEDADEQTIIETVTQNIELRLPKFATTFRDGLEVLQGDERLDKSAIKGLEEYVKSETTKHGTSPVGFRPRVNGTKLGIVQNLDFVGSGVSHSKVNGLDTITFTGGSGVTVETPPETPDGSIVTFTVSAQPQWVDTEAGHYYEGYGYSYSAGTITLDLPPNKPDQGGYVRIII